jgi:hypothetical protein
MHIDYPWNVAITIMSFFSTIFLAIYSLFFEDCTFDFNDEKGIFGLLTVKWILLHIMIGLITGIVVLVL